MINIVLDGTVMTSTRSTSHDAIASAMKFRADEDNANAGIRKGDTISVRGCMSPDLVKTGMPLRLSALLFDDKTIAYLKAQIRLVPGNEAAVTGYLATGAVARLTRAAADRIVVCFGPRALEILDGNPAKIMEVKGVGEAVRKRVVECWAQDRKTAKPVIETMSIGLSLATAKSAVEHFGPSAADRLLANPYLLSSLHGYGYAKSDQFARMRGVEDDSDERIRAAFLYCLNSAAYEGHSYLPVRELLDRVSKETSMPPERIKETSFPDSIVVTPGNKAYTAELYEAERYVGRCIERMTYENSFSSLTRENITAIIDATPELSEDQRQALFKVLTGPRISVITGMPGTGKTTLIRTLLQVLSAAGIKCVLAAPTGKAAARITEQTGQEAFTIHRLLGYSRDGSPRCGEGHQVKADCIVIDEFSMVDLMLMRQILQSIGNSTVLILVGDDNQLPSIGPGALLREIKEHCLCNIATLTDVHRQDSRSAIVGMAHAIHDGRVPEDIFGRQGCRFIQEDDPGKIRSTVVDLAAGGSGYPPDSVQVITPMRRTMVGSNQLNMALRVKMRKHNIQVIRSMGYSTDTADAPPVGINGQSFALGDRVIQRTNNYRKSVFNGEIGYVVSCGQEEDAAGGKITVLLDDGREVTYGAQETAQLELAYACTIHKAQGSEFPCCIIPVHTSNYIMLYRGLIYTAVTRAREMVILVGSRKALFIAIKKSEQEIRYANLSGKNL